MFFLRGCSYLIAESSIPIDHPLYSTLSGMVWKMPGGGRLSLMALVMLAVVALGILLAHRTRFGNQVYAIGGNMHSAQLMGVSTRATTVKIYMLSTFWRRWRASSFRSIPRRATRWRGWA